MPYCFYCGKEIYLILPFLRTKDCYCEHCRGHISVIPQGRVSEEELDRAKREFQRNYVFNMKPGMAYKEVVNRMLAQKAYKSNIIMFHPDERDREPWSTLVAEIRHRKDVTFEVETLSTSEESTRRN